MSIIRLNKRYTYDELMEVIYILTETYKFQINLRIIGKSHDERKIPLLEIGKGKEVLLSTAGVHGRESVNPLIILKIVEEYCQAYEKKVKIDGLDVARLLKDYKLCFIPLLNPDGYVIAIEGFDKIRNPILRQNLKMKNIAYESWKYNGRGIDINRNFPAKSYITQNPGESPESERETKALIEVFHEYNTIAYLDFHSRGRIIYYYREAMPFLYNQKGQHLAEGIQRVSGYKLGEPEEELLTKTSGGNTVHYYSEQYKKPAITIETIEDEAAFPLDIHYQEQTFQEIHRIPLVLLEMFSEEK